MFERRMARKASIRDNIVCLTGNIWGTLHLECCHGKEQDHRSESFSEQMTHRKGLVIMKVRVILLVTSVLIVSGMALTMAGCSEEEPPPMENVPTDPDYNKAPSDKD